MYDPETDHLPTDKPKEDPKDWFMRVVWLVAITLILLYTALALTGCTGRAESTNSTTNPNYKLERLFEHDGCTVYRFYDAGSRYYTDCRGSAMWDEYCGKSCTYQQHNRTNDDSYGR